MRQLKHQNLLIEDEEKAKEILSTCGYSSVIKSYRRPYIVFGENGELRYRDGVTFEQIFSLYVFDKNLRSAVIAAMLDLEEHVKATSAEVLAEHFGASTKDYLDYRKYRNKRKRKQQFSLQALLQKLNNTLGSEKDPIHHCMEKYGDVPPWILFRTVYFSTIVNFIDQFKPNEQNALVEKLYGDLEQIENESAKRFLLMDSLFICMEYRNHAAHGGRIYNYSATSRFRANEFFGHQNAQLSGFSILLVVLDLFKYRAPYNRVSRALNAELNRHFDKYPQDITYLSQIMNIDIYRTDEANENSSLDTPR